MLVCDMCCNMYEMANEKIIFKPSMQLYSDMNCLNSMTLDLCEDCYDKLFQDIKSKIEEANIERFS